MAKSGWEAIRREYETDGVSARKLAKKYGISHTAINQRAKAEGWNKPEKKVSTKKVESGKVETKQSKTQPLHDDQVHGISNNVTPEKNDSPGFNPADFGLSEKQGIFAEHIAVGKKIIEAYRLAGYEGKGNAAYVTASQLLRNPKIYRAVSFLRDQRQKQLALTEKEIIHQLSAIACADPNELIQHRRVNCRYCWGEKHLYQWRDIEEFDKASEKASKDGKPQPQYGGLGFVQMGFPNEDCPKCGGEGEHQLFIADTTQVEGNARWLYAGVKQTKNGIEVCMASQEAARRDLIKILDYRKNPIVGGSDKRSPSDYSPNDYRDAVARLEDEFKDLD